jgi:hypothetical protein
LTWTSRGPAAAPGRIPRRETGAGCSPPHPAAT